MKITIYTVSDCQFSKQEKEYLKSKNLQFEEKNLETNKEFLTEMLAVSDNFAGTPVTRIEKDDGQVTVLKGFTQDEFDVALGYKKPEEEAKPEEVKQDISQVSTPMSAQPTTDTPTPTPPPPPVSPVIEPPSDSPAPQTPIPPPTAPSEPQSPTTEPTPPPPATDLPPEPVVEPPTPATPTPQEPAKPEGDEKLSGVLDNLQSLSGDGKDSPEDKPATPPPPSNMPSIPDPKFG